MRGIFFIDQVEGFDIVNRKCVKIDVLDKYLDALVGCLEFMSKKNEVAVGDALLVENGLTLTCPNSRCEVALDPNPGSLSHPPPTLTPSSFVVDIRL